MTLDRLRGATVLCARARASMWGQMCVFRNAKLLWLAVCGARGDAPRRRAGVRGDTAAALGWGWGRGRAVPVPGCGGRAPVVRDSDRRAMPQRPTRT